MSKNKTYSGIDDAQVEDRNPKFSPDGSFLAEVTMMKEIEGNESGQTFVTEFKVLESDKEEDPVGSVRAVTFTGLDGPKNSVGPKLARMRALFAACMGCDQAQPPPTGGTWKQIWDAAKDEDQALFVGCVVRIKTLPQRESKGGNMYTPTSFSQK